MFACRNSLCRSALGRLIHIWYEFTLWKKPHIRASLFPNPYLFFFPSPQKEVGAWNYLQITEGLEAFTYAIFTRRLGYSQKEIDVICANIRRELQDSKLHVLFYLYVHTNSLPVTLPPSPFTPLYVI